MKVSQLTARASNRFMRAIDVEVSVSRGRPPERHGRTNLPAHNRLKYKNKAPRASARGRRCEPTGRTAAGSEMRTWSAFRSIARGPCEPPSGDARTSVPPTPSVVSRSRHRRRETRSAYRNSTTAGPLDAVVDFGRSRRLAERLVPTSSSCVPFSSHPSSLHL